MLVFLHKNRHLWESEEERTTSLYEILGKMWFKMRSSGNTESMSFANALALDLVTAILPSPRSPETNKNLAVLVCDFCFTVLWVKNPTYKNHFPPLYIYKTYFSYINLFFLDVSNYLTYNLSSHLYNFIKFWENLLMTDFY